MTAVADQAVPASDLLDDLAPVVEEIRAGARQRDLTRSYAVREVERLRAVGFWALTTPAAYGGLGLGAETLVRAIMAIAAADGSLGQIPQNHFMTVERVRLGADGEQRDHWLTALGRGAVFGNATAEPGELAPGERTTTVEPIAGGWRVQGRKVYSTGSLLADYIAVAATSPEDESWTVLVPAKHPGVTIHDDWQGLGQRTTGSGTSEFRGVVVDDLAVLRGDVPTTVTYRVSALGQLVHAAIDAGIAEGALREALTLAGRVHGGRGTGAKAFADDALGVALVGELHIETLSARRLVESAARRLEALDDASALDEVVDVFYEVAAAKTQSTRAALDVTARLFDVGGASSTRPELGLDRYWRDARTHTLHDAVRQKPHSIGRWLLAGDVADPWSIGHPMRPITDLRTTHEHD